MSRNDYEGQCYCYPAKKGDDCEHCNRARQWLDRDVYCLANELGEDLLASPDDCDELHNLWVPICSEAGCASENMTLGWDGDDEIYRCEDCGETILECEVESNPAEIMQWFIVSDYLYRQLHDIGQPVAEYKGLCLWGRTCYGQGIELDGIFQRISRDL